MSKRRRRAHREQARQAAVMPRRPPRDEIGGTGLRISGGKVLEEYNPDLKGPKLYDEYDKMLRGDGQVQAVELVATLPPESTEWRVDPNAAGEPVDLEIADGLTNNLFSGMTITWPDVIAETMMAPLMGVNVLEAVWEQRDGMTWLRKLAPRHPRTIVEWILDAEGGVQGIKQRVTDPTTGVTTDRPIEIARLLRFTFRGQGGNPEGRGIMRPMRTHYYIKHALYHIANQGFEGLYNPAAVGKLPQNYTAGDKDQYLAVLRHFGRGVTLPPGWESPEFPAGNQRLPSITDYITYHDILMARSALAQFLQLGSGDTGSWALSDSHVTLFLMAIETMLKQIAAVFDRFLIPQWVGYNYPGMDRFPSLGWTPVAHVVQKMGLLQVLKDLVAGQLVRRDDELEDMIREWIGLPPRSREEDSDTEETIPQEDIGASHRLRSLKAARRELRRPRDKEKIERDRQRLSAAQDKFQKDMGQVVERQHAALMKKLEPLIRAYREAPDLEKGKHLLRMRQVSVPKVSEYYGMLREWMLRLLTTAREKAAKDLGLEVPETISNAMRSWITSKADVMADDHANQLRSAVLYEVLEQARLELPVGRIIRSAEQAARDKSSFLLDEGLREAGAQLVATLEDMLSLMLPETEPAGAE